MRGWFIYDGTGMVEKKRTIIHQPQYLGRSLLETTWGYPAKRFRRLETAGPPRFRTLRGAGRVVSARSSLPVVTVSDSCDLRRTKGNGIQGSVDHLISSRENKKHVSYEPKGLSKNSMIRST